MAAIAMADTKTIPTIEPIHLRQAALDDTLFFWNWKLLPPQFFRDRVLFHVAKVFAGREILSLVQQQMQAEHVTLWH